MHNVSSATSGTGAFDYMRRRKRAEHLGIRLLWPSNVTSHSTFLSLNLPSHGGLHLTSPTIINALFKLLLVRYVVTVLRRIVNTLPSLSRTSYIKRVTRFQGKSILK